MKYLGFLIVVLTLSFGCKQAADSDKKQDSSEIEKVMPKIENVSSLPSIPQDLLTQVYMECDFVDYIFYELPFSMSYDKQATIQSALRWVHQSTNMPTSGCKALGRMIFQKKGEVMIEAEIYVSEACSYYKWILDGKAVYNNIMSKPGVNHYMNIIQQFENKQQ